MHAELVGVLWCSLCSDPHVQGERKPGATEGHLPALEKAHLSMMSAQKERAGERLSGRELCYHSGSRTTGSLLQPLGVPVTLTTMFLVLLLC